MALEWTNKTDLVDDILASDINSIAAAVIANENNITQAREDIAANETAINALDAEIKNNKPIITKNTTVTIPARHNVTYTTLWNDDLTSLILTTDAEGLSSDNLSSNFGIWIEAPNGNTIGSVLSEEETDVAKIVRGAIAVTGSNIFGVVDGENYTVTISNLTSTDVNVFVEELRLNETFTEYFATQSKVEEIVKGETTVLDARLDALESNKKSACDLL